MRKSLIALCALALGIAGFAAHAQAGVSLAPLGATKPLPVESHVQQVRSRAGAFFGGLALGALLAYGLSRAEAEARLDEEWRWEKCARRYRSFEWDTGLYTTYGGEKRLCPYLR